MSPIPLNRCVIVEKGVRMKKHWYNVVLILMCSFSCRGYDWIYTDFDTSMKLDLFPTAIKMTQPVVGIDGTQLYTFFKKIYEQYNPSRIAPAIDIKIPKIIHQIWLGSPVPDVFEAYMNSWIAFHMGNDWQYVLWNDEKIKNFGLYNQVFYDATENFGQKSDIARWEILYNFGGVYVDVDFECLRSFDQLHYLYDFYVGLQPLDSQFVQLNNALVGSCPFHPILYHSIATIKDNWHTHKGAPQKTGPVHFTRSFYAKANTGRTIDMVFPASYFYPLGTQETVNNKQAWLKQGAYAVHWWAKTWMPKKYRRSSFQSIDNESSTHSWND